MGTPVVAALAVAAMLALLDWWAVAQRHRRLEAVAKPAVIVALGVAVVLLEPVDPVVRGLVLVALAASLIGDIALLPGGPFLAGVAAFTVAQVAYAASFVVRPLEPMGLAAGVAIGIVVAIAVGRPILRAAPDGLRTAVVGYLVVILAMASFATGTLVPAAVVGAWLFVTSDATLAWSRFVAPAVSATIPWRLAVIATYHLAQGLLVLSLVG